MLMETPAPSILSNSLTYLAGGTVWCFSPHQSNQAGYHSATKKGPLPLLYFRVNVFSVAGLLTPLTAANIPGNWPFATSLAGSQVYSTPFNPASRNIFRLISRYSLSLP